jgi:large subunit ribosomal protein L23
MQPFDVLLKPIVSEKSTDLREADGRYTFEVHMKANKLDVKRAIKQLYSVEPESVRTMIIRGKTKRRGAKVYKVGNFKKAIVKLPVGEKLPIFEDQ